MSTYSDHDQRLLDQQSGEEMDRQAKRREARDTIATAPIPQASNQYVREMLRMWLNNWEGSLRLYDKRCNGPLDELHLIVDSALDETSAANEFVDRSVFDAELKALGERMAADGKIVIKQLLFEAEVNGRTKCLFYNWPDHLKNEVYSRLRLDPVEMFRRRAVKTPDDSGIRTIAKEPQ